MLDPVPSTLRHLAGIVAAVVVLGGCAAGASPEPTGSRSAETAPRPQPDETLEPVEVASFDKDRFSIDDPTSLWVVSNKLRPLTPLNWAPTDIVVADVPAQWSPRVRAEVAPALVEMFAAAEAEGAGGMQVQSAWRSFETQQGVYADWVARVGESQADLQSARPGHSEHQTGLAVDVSPIPLTCALDPCFADTPQGQWLDENAWRFGFILRYPNGKTEITGYVYEPWHLRFVGKELAAELRDRGILTLEEFFGLPPAPRYAP